MPDSYTAAELTVDLAVYSIGTLAGVAAVIVLLAITIRNHGNPHFAAILVYAVGLLAMLFSAAYNLTLPSRWKEALRRCDHGAIFPMIAGTCTPFVASIADPRWRWGLMSLWERLRFHNSIWRALVVIAVGFHYCAVLFGIALASAE